MAKSIVNDFIYVQQSLDKLTYCADTARQRSGRQNDLITQKFSNKSLDQEVIYV